MQTARQLLKYKFEQFQIAIIPYADQKLSISVIDPISSAQFKEQMLQLVRIGTSTLIKALQQKMKEIKIAMKVIKNQSGDILQIDILVASLFLRPVEETIYLKKIKDVSQSELINIYLDRISQKIANLKKKEEPIRNQILCGMQTRQKSYNSNNYENLVSAKLPKGKYILTFSFLAKVTDQGMYLYFGQGQQAMPGAGFYLPTSSYFMPVTIRKVHQVNNEEQTISFTTTYASSCPITLKNAILTANPI